MISLSQCKSLWAFCLLTENEKLLKLLEALTKRMQQQMQYRHPTILTSKKVYWVKSVVDGGGLCKEYRSVTDFIATDCFVARAWELQRGDLIQCVSFGRYNCRPRFSFCSPPDLYIYAKTATAVARTPFGSRESSQEDSRLRRAKLGEKL